MKAKTFAPKEGEVKAMPFTNKTGENADLFEWLHEYGIRNYTFSSTYGAGVLISFVAPGGKELEAEEGMLIVRQGPVQWTTMRAETFFDRYDEVPGD